MTDKDKREITQMRRGGMGYGRIARLLGIPLSTVKSYCRRNNLLGRAGGRSACSVVTTLNRCYTERRKNFARMAAG